jgi:hypothetical protein
MVFADEDLRHCLLAGESLETGAILIPHADVDSGDL